MKNLKKLFFATVATAIASTYVSAQNIAFGPKLGISATAFEGDINNQEGRGSLLAGLFFNTGSSSIFAFQTELLLHQKGSYSENTTFNVSRDIEVNYLEIPMMVKFGLPIDQTFYPNFYLGGYYASRLNSTYQLKQLDGGFTISDDVNTAADDYGYIMGLGLDVFSDNLFFTLDGRYGIGQKNISTRDNEELYNRSFTVSAGVGLRF